MPTLLCVNSNPNINLNRTSLTGSPLSGHFCVLRRCVEVTPQCLSMVSSDPLFVAVRISLEVHWSDYACNNTNSPRFQECTDPFLTLSPGRLLLNQINSREIIFAHRMFVDKPSLILALCSELSAQPTLHVMGLKRGLCTLPTGFRCSTPFHRCVCGYRSDHADTQAVTLSGF